MLDRGLIELIGPLGVVRGLKILTNKISNLQSGLIYHYALTMILGVVFFIILFILPIPGINQFFLCKRCGLFIRIYC